MQRTDWGSATMLGAVLGGVFWAGVVTLLKGFAPHWPLAATISGLAATLMVVAAIIGFRHAGTAKVRALAAAVLIAPSPLLAVVGYAIDHRLWPPQATTGSDARGGQRPEASVKPAMMLVGLLAGVASAGVTSLFVGALLALIAPLIVAGIGMVCGATDFAWGSVTTLFAWITFLASCAVLLSI